MNPIYKFELTIGTTTQRCYPIYKDDLTKDFELQSNQQFFRAKLSGKLTFERADYDRIVSAAFDSQFLLEIFISYNAGQTWTSYWTGTFWKTDCDFDGDAKTVRVTPTVKDKYNDVLAGMEKEFNLIELLPEIVPVKFDKRPMIQVYVPGQTVIACFLSGMWWEQECESVLESDTVEIEGQTYPALEYKYHFSVCKTIRVVEITQGGAPILPPVFTGEIPETQMSSPYEIFHYANGGFEFGYSDYSVGGGGGGTRLHEWGIIRQSDNQLLWYLYQPNQYSLKQTPYTVTLQPVDGSGASGTVTAYVHDIKVYARYVLDVDTILGLSTYELPTDDLVENNRNYHRAIGYAFEDVIYFSTRLVTTPTQWGIYQPGQYYQQPYLYWYPELFPVARNSWGRVSIWFSFSAFDWLVEESGREPFTLKDAFPLWSVISVLLAKIAPNLTHANTTDYSQFLYGTNPLTGITQTLLITPKSNIVSAGYDQPAQQAPITLKYVMDMLRDCFRCYWFVDSQGRFRIEHIRYFMLGGTYSGTPVVGLDLTAEKVTRNNKEWAFARNQYQFDKPDSAARYQFGWMDDVTKLFNGFPIDIISKYVEPGNIEEISVSQFTSDIDYILLNPGEISKDGFVLLSAGPRQYANTVQAQVGVEYDNRIYGNFAAGERVVVSFTPSGVFENDFVVLRDETDVIANIYYGQTYEITLPRNATYLRLVRAGAKVQAAYNVTFYLKRYAELALPYVTFHLENADYILQNAYVSFMYLQRYYAYDMPAPLYSINNEQMYAIGTKKLKTQTLKFPMLTDPDISHLIKTNIGNGMIQKLSVNLSSRNANATLKYDTE